MNELEQTIQLRIAALTVECFQSKSVLHFQCQRNGPPVSASEFVLCRFFQNFFLDSEGSVDRSKRTEAQAKMATESLKALLSTMLSDLVDKGYDINELMAKWDGLLRQFDKASLRVSEFVAYELGECYQRARTQVDRERHSENTSLGQLESSLKPSKVRRPWSNPVRVEMDR
jgi:hypothetical protein